jgi:hypothetical protein
MFAAASLVAPPLFGVSNKVLPYVPLSAMGTLETEEGFLAGVMNPMFLENRKCHDISIRIDEGKYNADGQYQKQEYYNLDQEFFESIATRVKEKNISDEEIRVAFQSYTMLMLDIAQNPAYESSPETAGLLHNGEPLSQLFLARTRRLKGTHLYRVQMSLMKLMELDTVMSRSFDYIRRQIKTLRSRGWPDCPLPEDQVRKIYQDIDTFIQDERSAVKVLYLLPVCKQGVGLLAHGLFYDDDLVQELTCKILTKL